MIEDHNSCFRVSDVFFITEGFYDYENSRYIYQYQDHLGNVRLSFTRNLEDGSAEALSSNDYYPFGLNFINVGGRTIPQVYNPSVSFENYKYNGKELQETGMYDYGARFYMPDIGRWGHIDPLAEKDRKTSPFVYAFNNPIRFIDPDGMEGEEAASSDSRGGGEAGGAAAGGLPGTMGRDSAGNQTVNIGYGANVSAGTAAISSSSLGDGGDNDNSSSTKDSGNNSNLYNNIDGKMDDYSLDEPTSANNSSGFSFNKSPSDIIIYLATKGASGLGHMGTGIGNDNDGWIYISKDGRANGTLGKGGDSKFTVMTFKTYNQMNQYVKSLDYNYNEITRFNTNASQDYRAATSAVYNAMSGYHAKDNNCSAVTNAAMYSAGFRVGISSIPNISYYELRFWNSSSIKK